MPNRIDLVVHYLACFRAAIVATPLNYRYTAREIDHALEVSGARAPPAAPAPPARPGPAGPPGSASARHAVVAHEVHGENVRAEDHLHPHGLEGT